MDCCDTTVVFVIGRPRPVFPFGHHTRRMQIRDVYKAIVITNDEPVADTGEALSEDIGRFEALDIDRLHFCQDTVAIAGGVIVGFGGTEIGGR